MSASFCSKIFTYQTVLRERVVSVSPVSEIGVGVGKHVAKVDERYGQCQFYLDLMMQIGLLIDVLLRRSFYNDKSEIFTVKFSTARPLKMT